VDQQNRFTILAHATLGSTAIKNLVSIILPTYNRAHLLARAVRSVLQQTFSDWELRIVDDGSMDETAALAEEFVRSDSRVQYVRQENRGVSAARNVAIFSTESPWIAFVDSDDEWLPNKLELQLKYAEENPHIRLIHSEENWWRNGKLLQRLKRHEKLGGRVFRSCLPLCYISPSTVMIRTELIRMHGGFREDFLACEDYDLWLKISMQEEVGVISEPLINKYGGHEDQLSARKVLDEYRARALWEMRDHPALTVDDRTALLEEFARKRDILIKGYEKHGHLEKAAFWRQL
jgi:glycosyltransferase involved in cell wall biosynthesis